MEIQKNKLKIQNLAHVLRYGNALYISYVISANILIPGLFPIKSGKSMEIHLNTYIKGCICGINQLNTFENLLFPRCLAAMERYRDFKSLVGQIFVVAATK